MSWGVEHWSKPVTKLLQLLSWLKTAQENMFVFMSKGECGLLGGTSFTLTKVGLRERHGALLYVGVVGGLIVQTHLGHWGCHVLPGVMPCGDLLNVTAQEKQQMFTLNTSVEGHLHFLDGQANQNYSRNTMHHGHFSMILQSTPKHF